MEREKGIQSSGKAAKVQVGVVANENAIIIEALEEGVEGNAYSITMIDPPGNNAALSVDVTNGTDVIVNLATDGSSAVTSKADQVIDAINDDVDANDIVMATNAPGSNGSGTAVAVAKTPLAGGTKSVVHHVTLDEVVTDPNGELAVQIPDDEYVNASNRDTLAVHERPTPNDVFND